TRSQPTPRNRATRPSDFGGPVHESGKSGVLKGHSFSPRRISTWCSQPRSPVNFPPRRVGSIAGSPLDGPSPSLRHASPTPELAYADDACFRGNAPSKATRPSARVENAAQPVRLAQCNVGELHSHAHGDPRECGKRSTPLTAPFIFC